MQRARYWRQELGFDVVQLDNDNWYLLEDPYACRVMGFPWLVGIQIDANDYAGAVGDCLWSLYRIRQAYLHADMDHGDARQSAGVVHVRHAGYLLCQERFREPRIPRAIEQVVLGWYEVERDILNNTYGKLPVNIISGT